MMKSKIMITGAAGYIGSHTMLELIRNGNYEIIAVDNYSNSTAQTYERIQSITGVKIKSYEIDLCQEEATQKIFRENPDIRGVIHFAALKSVPESVNKPIAYYKNNIESLLNVLKYCEEFGVKIFIFSSSCSVYGNVTMLPVNENTPLFPVESPYAHTKLLGEEILKSLSAQGKIKPLLLRYFNPVGADRTGKLGENPTGQVNNLVPIITKTAIGSNLMLKVFGNNYDTRDGSCIRDYIHVTDIADAHVKALEYGLKMEKDLSYEIFNLGSGNGVTVFEAIHAFEKVSGVKLNYEIVDRRPGDVASIYSNSAKAKEILKWVPKYDINEMMRTAWEWQKNVSE